MALAGVASARSRVNHGAAAALGRRSPVHSQDPRGVVRVCRLR